MAKYRKRPVVVEAMQFDPHTHWPAGVHSWREANYRPRDMSWGYIDTVAGRAHVQAGDWIVKEPAGQLSLCKDDAFRRTYDPVED